MKLFELENDIRTIRAALLIARNRFDGTLDKYEVNPLQRIEQMLGTLAHKAALASIEIRGVSADDVAKRLDQPRAEDRGALNDAPAVPRIESRQRIADMTARLARIAKDASDGY